jgi:hypothetical protein
VLALPIFSNLSLAKKRLSQAKWRLAKRQFVHTAKFAAGRAASLFLGPLGGAIAGNLLHSHDAHACTSDNAHHTLAHVSHAAHEWMPVIGWGISITRAVRGYTADPVVSSSHDEIELWSRAIRRLRMILAVETSGAIAILMIVLR